MFRNVRIVKSQLDHTFDLIEVLAEGTAALGVSELATRIGQPKSGVHRLLGHLVDRGWVEQDPATQRYRLTLRFALIGKRFLASSRIEDLCQPILEELARETSELVRMSFVQDRRLVWLASVQGAPPGLMYAPSMTSRIPLHATANGKAWLSTLPLEEAMAILLEDGLSESSATGPRAIRDLESMVEELRRTAERGYAVALEEAEPGIVAIAAPVTLAGGATIGAVSVAAPVHRIAVDRHASIAERVCRSARELADRWPLSPFSTPRLRLAT